MFSWTNIQGSGLTHYTKTNTESLYNWEKNPFKPGCMVNEELIVNTCEFFKLFN